MFNKRILYCIVISVDYYCVLSLLCVLLCTFEFYTVYYSVMAAHKWLDPVLTI